MENRTPNRVLSQTKDNNSAGISSKSIVEHAQVLAFGTDPDIAEIICKSLVRQEEDYPAPETVIELVQAEKRIPIATRGSISTLIGKAKGRKTALAALMGSAVIRSAICADNAMISCPISGGTVLWMDTEQGRYYSSVNQRHILDAAWEERSDRLRYYDLREYSPDKRTEVISELVHTTPDLTLVVIDGIRDLIFDINDPGQAVTTVNHIMRWSQQHNCHIISVLHQNKENQHARGHLGTELVNKSETVISVNKDKDDENISTVQPEFMRGMHFEPFAIGHNEYKVPCIVEHWTPKQEQGYARRVISPGEISEEVHREILNQVFRSETHQRYSDLNARICTAIEVQTGTSLGSSSARKWVTYYVDKRFIKKVGKPGTKAAYYILAPPD